MHGLYEAFRKIFEVGGPDDGPVMLLLAAVILCCLASKYDPSPRNRRE